jgi:hypothetical protein
MHLQPSRIRSPIITGLNRIGCGLRRLLALFRSFSNSTSSGRLEISLEIRRLVIGQPGVGNCRFIVRLPIDMREDDTIGIDDAIPAGHRLDRPGLGKAAGGHIEG